MKPVKYPEEYRRGLPHLHKQGAVFFLTFRLKDSIPLMVIQRLRDKPSHYSNHLIDSGQVKVSKQNRFFRAMENYLDATQEGIHYLKIDKIAQLVADSIQFRDGKDYKLICYSIMSNHVHLIIYKLQKPLTQILKELKGYTGKEAMKIMKQLEKEGSTAFWQSESFDRIVRSKNDLSNKIAYVLNNPVKAGLAEHWKDYPWNYCRKEFIEF